MASVKRLKKDIEFHSAQLIGDCIEYIEYFEGANDDAALEIIKDAVKLHNEMLDRANHPDGKDNPKLVKAHYQKLRKDYVSGLDAAYTRLEELVKA